MALEDAQWTVGLVRFHAAEGGMIYSSERSRNLFIFNACFSLLPWFVVVLEP
jgi:hypothetical protein